MVVDSELSCIDNADSHARTNGVEEEHRVQGLAHPVVALKGEREVGDATGDVGQREFFTKGRGGLDHVEAVTVVFGNTGGHGEDVRVEDDVLGRHLDLVNQNAICPTANLYAAFDRVRLALFVKSHDDDCRTMVAAHGRLFAELLFAGLQRDRVDYRLSLEASQSSFDDVETRGVNHDRHAGDIGFGCEKAQESGHLSGRIEKALVHVDVDGLRPRSDLLARDIERFGVVSLGDQAAKFRRTEDVGAFADIDERDLIGKAQWFKAGKFQ